MFLINITLKPETIADAERDTLFAAHRAWFTRHFEQGRFLLTGPYLDTDNAGVIIARADSRAELAAILAEDAYHAGAQADYEVREFKAAKISGDFKR